MNIYDMMPEFFSIDAFVCVFVCECVWCHLSTNRHVDVIHDAMAVAIETRTEITSKFK